MHVAITGASSGIGAALAREWAAAGAKLTLVARRKPLLDELAASLQTQCQVAPHDLSVPEQAADWLAAAEAALGPIDVLVNNAGVQVIGPSGTIDIERAEAQLRTNLLSPLRIIRAALPGMLARKAGVIVSISSMAALAPTPGMTWYNASKGGLAAASESLRGELRKTGVGVVTVYPGIIDATDMGKSGLASYQQTKLVALQPRGTPEELARLVRRAVEKRSARVIYPRVYHFTRWFPGATRFMLDRFTPPMTGA